MSARSLPGAPDPEGSSTEESAESAEPLDAAAPDPAPRTRPPRWLAAAAVAVVLTLLLGGVLAYRSWQERRIVALSVTRARHLIRSDTWFGYREAAALLELRAARVDPLGAGSLRALALALLAADYRDEAAGREAQALLVAPSRADVVPVAANLATAALALARGEIGNTVMYASRAGDVPLAHVLRARAASMAGNPVEATAAAERALALDAALPAARALHGDLLRRGGDAAGAAAAYAAALGSSARELEAGLARDRAPGAAATHARAGFGLAKLALSRQGEPDAATQALERIVTDRAATPGVERARAALHLSALRARAGDRAAAARAIADADLDDAARAWVERAAALEEVERGAYRVVDGTPRALVSASDDDPYVPPPAATASRAEPTPPKYPPGFKVHPASRGKRHENTAAKKKSKRAALRP
jgi:tetratricopeptide (TPR) repeat protein